MCGAHNHALKFEMGASRIVLGLHECRFMAQVREVLQQNSLRQESWWCCALLCMCIMHPPWCECSVLEHAHHSPLGKEHKVHKEQEPHPASDEFKG